MYDKEWLKANRPLVIIAGPTAVGKTRISVSLAKRMDGEIISADSMQVYRGMDIGTAKIRPEEMEGVKHHLIDIIEPDEEFSVMIFREKAMEAVNAIYENGHLPIVAGGTGFYIQALLYDIDFTEYDDEKQKEVRSELEAELEKCGALYMHEKLRAVDPDSAAIIHMNNTKRMLHALEYYIITGRRISEHNSEMHEKTSPFKFKYFVINDEREKVYDNINRRVDIMFEQGLAEEVDGLLKSGISPELPSMLGLGYKETADWLLGKTTGEEAVYLIKRDTRHFAKKQLVWFKREKITEFIEKKDFPNEEEIVSCLEKRIRESILFF